MTMADIYIVPTGYQTLLDAHTLSHATLRTPWCGYSYYPHLPTRKTRHREGSNLPTEKPEVGNGPEGSEAVNRELRLETETTTCKKACAVTHKTDKRHTQTT